MLQRKPLAAAISSIVAAGAIGAVGAAAPNHAYGAERVIEEVVVTGSRIRRPDLDAVSPVTVVDSAEFSLSGIMNVEQKLAELPQSIPSFGPSSNNPGDGTARVDLRGLGDFRTLVLVNGRRYMPATQTAVVDLNTIPASLLERVDVVTGGASAVYGSDAMAGVVNFVLKDDFEGVELNALYDITEEGDAEKFNTDVTIGGNFADGRGNAVVYLQYSDREALFQGDRSFTEFALTESGNQLVPGGSSGIPGTRVFGGPVINEGSADEFVLGRFNPDGSGAAFQDPEDLFNYAPDNFLQLPQERFMAHAMGHYDITDQVRAYSEITFSQNEVPQELAPTPAFVGTLEVNPDSPFFGAGVQEALDGIRSDTNGDGVIDDEDNAFLPFIGRRMVENGPRQAIDNRDSYRMLIGVEGEINPDWSFDLFASHSRMDNQQALENDVAASRFRQAILVTDDGTACQNPAGGCAPLNIFGAGNISQDAVNFVKVGASNITSVELDVIQGSVTGAVANPISDAGQIGLVLGAEYREDSSSFRPDTFLSTGDVLGFNAGQETVGSYDVNEFFAEVDVPIVAGRPGMEYLGVWGAYRYSDYSNIGGVSSFAATVNYSPVDDVRFRGGFQRATRAPNVFELFQGSANGFPPATDPCSADGTTSPSAELAAVCEATGVPAGLTGTFNQPNTQIEGIFGGNADLIEETADTWTFGVIYQPQWAQGLDVSMDYYDIEIEDAIDVFGGGVNNTLDICYNLEADPSSPFCNVVSRRGDGNVDTVEVLNANIGLIETSGVDLNVNYNMPLTFGIQGNESSLDITYRSNFLLKYEETPVAGFPTVFECEGNFGNTCGRPRSEYTHNVRATWTSGPLTVSTLWRFLSEVDDDRIDNQGVSSSDLVVDNISAEHYVDLTGAYQFTDAFRVSAGVKNLFDEFPTKVGDVQQQANTFPEVYDVIGRRYFVSGTYKF